MNLEHEVGARGHFLGGSSRVDRRHVAGGVTTKMSERLTALPSRFVVIHVDNDVVHDRAVARLCLACLNPAILREFAGNAEPNVLDNTLCGDDVGFGDLDDQVGLADGPSLGKRRSRRFSS